MIQTYTWRTSIVAALLAATWIASAATPVGKPSKLADLSAGIAEAVQQAAGSTQSPSQGPFTTQQELTPSKGAAGDAFGFSVALSGDGHTALVGAPSVNSNEGAAYIFTWNNNVWTELQELTPSHGKASDYFGYSVALSGDGHTALIGAFGANADKGAAYIFTLNHNSYVQQDELTAAKGAAADRFGQSVALDNDGHIALVGAYAANSGKGAAYIFTENHNAYTPEELTASKGAAGDHFGWSVALSGDGHTALIGAVGGDSGKGAAYLFMEQHNSYEQEQELTASNGKAGDWFGSSVALDNDGHVALVGAYRKSSDRGAAYIFAMNGNTYNQEQELTEPKPAEGDWFGWSVALDNNGQSALVGAPGNNSDQGAAYLYAENHNTYAWEQTLTESTGQVTPPPPPPPPPSTDPSSASKNAGPNYFGISVALDNNGHIAPIGASGKSPQQGAAYIFTH